MLRSFLSLATLLIVTSAALAHEGHGHPAHQHGVTHYVVNPSHAVPILLTVAAVAGLGLVVRNCVRMWRA